MSIFLPRAALSVGVLWLPMLCGSVLGDELPAISVPALTAEEQAALGQIRQSQVLGTVAFLAADEMAGRNTPSPELTIASAYVAARFRGAGLEPLGPDGSYFQRQELAQFGPPAMPAQLQLGDAVPLNAPVIFAADRPLQLAGLAVDPRPGADQSGQLLLLDEPPLPPQAADNPAAAAAAVARRLQPLLAAKPSAVLIRAAVSSPLREALAAAAGRPLELPAALQPALAVVLVPDTLKAGQPLKLSVDARISQTVEVRNVAGVLRGSSPELAVALNGVLWSAGPASETPSVRGHWEALLPEAAFQPGVNRAEFFVIEPRGDGTPRLIPVVTRKGGPRVLSSPR